MSFQDAVRTCLQQKYANFSGRARRSEYWYFVLFYVLVLFVWGVVGNLVSGSSVLYAVWGLVGAVAVIGLIVPSLAVGVRRLHDTGRSGWLMLLGVIPIVSIVGGIVLVVFECMDSTPGANQYGPNPKGIEPGHSYGYMPPAPPAPQQS